jgi:chorismate dehydratase
MNKVGISTYLNTLPLLYAIKNEIVKSDFKLYESLPHECSELLLKERYDAALIPSVEYTKGKDDWFIYDGFCIGSRDKVNSVELFFNKELEDIKTVAIDSSSRTSVILTKIILEEKFELEPEYITMNADLSTMLTKADAALIIADNALNLVKNHDNRLDLAEEWYDFTGLPFVFAFIAGFEQSLSKQDCIALDKSLEYGMSHLPEIIDSWYDESTATNSKSFYLDYLTQNIVYNFDDEMKEGLLAFYDYAFLRNEIPYIPELKYFRRD